MWPADEAALERAQDALAAAEPPPGRPEGAPPGRAGAAPAAGAPPRWPPGGEPLIGACFVCFGRGLGGRGARGEPGWAAAALDGWVGGRVPVAVVRGAAGAPYVAGRLATAAGPPPPPPADPPPP